MGWYSDTVDFLTPDGSKAEEFFNSEIVGGVIQGAAANELNKYFQPDIPKVGYQGKIPNLQAVRERVPMQQPTEGQPARRPGEAGRRYFSDVQYATRPKQETQTVEEAQAKARAQANDLAGIVPEPQTYAAGGIASAHNGYYLGGKTDGMADDVPASIDGKQEARLSDGEFVIPADVVSHLGNGNSDAGAEQLHGMMNGVRKARTGNPEQGKQIDPNKFMPKMAQGGIAQTYNNGGSVYKNQPKVTNYAGEDDANAVVGGEGAGTVDPNSTIGQVAGTESSLSNWAGDYVVDLLGQGKALGNQEYQAYEGPISAGASDLQDQAFTGVGSLDQGTMGVQDFTAADATAGMNPYLMASLNPQLDEARRQSEISRVANAGRMTKAGAFGGSRQALMDMEGQRGLQANLADITGRGYKDAYDVARDQFNKTQTARNAYGFDVLNEQQEAGATQRGIESEGMAADYAQFSEERQFPYTQVQYMKSLLQGLPLEAQTQSYIAPSSAAQLANTANTIDELYSEYGPGSSKPFNPATHGSATATQIQAELAANPSMTNAQIKAKYP
jgi:hypothetical protein